MPSSDGSCRIDESPFLNLISQAKWLAYGVLLLGLATDSLASGLAVDAAANVAPRPTPTPEAAGPTEDFLGPELVDSFRITTWEFWYVGSGSMNGVMEIEEDALVLTRVAMGEAPTSLDDRIYIMWLIRLRAKLGFKNAAYRGWDPPLDVWGPPTTIKQEALCWRGCQFSPARIADWTPFPASLPESSPIRAMLHPTDQQLPAFAITYEAAQWVLAQSFEQLPLELRGYDGFLSPSIAGEGRRYRSGGHKSEWFFNPYGNIWQDVYPEDNRWWEMGGD